MTNEQLCMMYQSGNKEVIEDLYKNNIGMIEKIIRRYAGADDLDDLRQESYFGILRAAELWSPDKGGSFITYAVFWIRQAIQSYLINCGGVVRIPANRRAQIGRYKKVIHAYQIQFGRDPSERELCAVLDLKREQLEELQKDIRALRIRSTSEVIGGEDDDLTLEDILPAEGDQYEDVIDRVQQEQLSRALWGAVDQLPEREAEVIRSRYKGNRTLKQCGDHLGISPERCRQLQDRGLRALRSTKVTKRLVPYLTENGAHSMGLKHTGLQSFRYTGISSPELAVMKLEELTRQKLGGLREEYLSRYIQTGGVDG